MSSKVPMNAIISILAASLPLIFSSTASAADEEPKAIGERAATALLTNLKTSLLRALTEGDAVKAAAFCSEEAMNLREEAHGDLPQGVTVKRVSTKHRNPNNAPDEVDSKVLDLLQNRQENKEPLPSHLVVRKGETTRYYKPILTGALCLTCHGDPKGFPPELKNLLEERYPEDKAVGYKKGELRGAVRVNIPISRESVEAPR